MIQVGAYSEYWPDIHMTPDEGLRTHLDLQGGEPGGVMMPIHWATFNLAMHDWAEPGERMMWATHDAGVTMAAPRPGEPFEPKNTPPVDPWWRAVSQQPVGGWAAWPPVGERLDLVAEG